MGADLVELIASLNDIIARETVLLEALDLRQAAALVGDKLRALQALQAACAEVRKGAPPDVEDDALRGSIALLERLSETNRSAIERGLALQMRLIQTIATAVPRARAEQAPIYRHNGSQVPPRPPEAFAFLSRM